MTTPGSNQRPRRKAALHGAVTLTDGQLMAAVSSGSAPAFGELYDRYSDRAYQLARSFCGDTRGAEEAVQAAFISIWKNRATYLQQPGTIAARLLTAVLDTARSTAQPTVPIAAENEPDPPAAVDHRVHRPIELDAEARRMRALLERLPDASERSSRLRSTAACHTPRLPPGSTCPPGTVNGRMRLGLQKIRTDSERDVA